MTVKFLPRPFALSSWLLCLGTSLVFAPGASAKTYEITRTDDPIPGNCRVADCSLREAISAANARPGADTVLLRGGKTYKMQLSGEEDANASGDFDVLDRLAIDRTANEVATVDAQGLDRVFHQISAKLTLSHLVITGGIAPGTGGAGGGIYNQEGKLRVLSSKVLDNAAPQGNGGGIASLKLLGIEASLSLSKSVVAHNSSLFGGGVNAQAPFGITRSTISRNESTGMNGAGGAYLAGPGTLSHVKVLNNESAGQGGGLFLNSNAANSFDHLTVVGNTAAAGGGGIAIQSFFPPTDVPRALMTTSMIAGNSAGDHGGGIFNRRRLRVTRSTISGNDVAGGGGGIANQDFSGGGPAQLELINDTITNNKADGFGGGIDNYESGELSLNNVTVAYNQADADGVDGGSGGGLQNAFEQGAIANVGNTLVVANTVGPSGASPTCAGTFGTLGANLLTDLAGCGGFSEGERLSGPPKIGPLGDNGGPTQTIALKRASPAINNGGPDCEPRDQRGVKRHDCDIGAYERP